MAPSQVIGHLLVASLLAISVSACSGSSADSTEPTASATTMEPASSSPTTATAAVDLVALIEGIRGYEFEPNPKAAQQFSQGAGGVFVVRSIFLDGDYQGVVAVRDMGSEPTEQDLRNFLAGAEDGGDQRGTTKRKSLGDVPAVETTTADGKTWSFAVGRFLVIVAATDAVADDAANQIVATF